MENSISNRKTLENDQSQSPGYQILIEAHAIEKELKHSKNHKGDMNDKTISNLRKNLREKYLQIMQLDPEITYKNNIQQSYWKNIVYKQIDYYRNLLKQKINKNDKGEKYQNILNNYLILLKENSKFYEKMFLEQLAISKIEFNNNVFLDLTSGIDDKHIQNSHKLLPALLYCHSCLIYMGDLERYIQLASDEKNWQKAACYYKQAINLFPYDGMAYNQLAVLATYTSNQLSAIYYYFRSFYIKDHPFNTSPQNLKLLFSKNLEKALHICPKLKIEKNSDIKDFSHFLSNISDLKIFYIFVVVFFSILYTGNLLSSTEPLEKLIIKQFEELLFKPLHSGTTSNSTKSISQNPPSTQINDQQKERFCYWIIELLINSICCVHHASNNLKLYQEAHPELSSTDFPSDIKGQKLYVLSIFSFIWIFDLMSLILRFLSPENTVYLPILIVFCEWLKLNPSMFSSPPLPTSIPFDNDLNVKMNKLFDHERSSRTEFWNLFISFINKINIDTILEQEKTLDYSKLKFFTEFQELCGFSFLEGNNFESILYNFEKDQFYNKRVKLMEDFPSLDSLSDQSNSSFHPSSSSHTSHSTSFLDHLRYRYLIDFSQKISLNNSNLFYYDSLHQKFILSLNPEEETLVIIASPQNFPLEMNNLLLSESSPTSLTELRPEFDPVLLPISSPSPTAIQPPSAENKESKDDDEEIILYRPPMQPIEPIGVSSYKQDGFFANPQMAHIFQPFQPSISSFNPNTSYSTSDNNEYSRDYSRYSPFVHQQNSSPQTLPYNYPWQYQPEMVSSNYQPVNNLNMSNPSYQSSYPYFSPYSYNSNNNFNMNDNAPPQQNQSSYSKNYSFQEGSTLNKKNENDEIPVWY